MTIPKPADVFFWTLALVAVGMFGAFVLVLAGAIPVEPAVEPRPATTQRVAAATASEAPATTETEREAERAPSATTTPAAPAAPAARLATVVVTASRGDCWLSARAGSADGRVLQELLLVEGESVRLRAAKVWLSLGAAANVDVVVDGEPQQVAAGTVELVLEPRSDA